MVSVPQDVIVVNLHVWTIVLLAAQILALQPLDVMIVVHIRVHRHVQQTVPILVIVIVTRHAMRNVLTPARLKLLRPARTAPTIVLRCVPKPVHRNAKLKHHKDALTVPHCVLGNATMAVLQVAMVLADFLVL